MKMVTERLWMRRSPNSKNLDIQCVAKKVSAKIYRTSKKKNNKLSIKVRY